MNKRYWLFSGDRYYPFGGMEDFMDSSDEIESLLLSGSTCDWAHIWDSDQQKVIRTLDAGASDREGADQWETTSETTREFSANEKRV